VDKVSRTSLALTAARVAEIAAVAHPTSTRRGFSAQTKTLMQAPELATLALLECALTLSVHALLAEHPTLAELREMTSEPATLRRARRMLALIPPLRRAVQRYRAAVFAVSQASDGEDYDDALPF
jgi:hypothetical protein